MKLFRERNPLSVGVVAVTVMVLAVVLALNAGGIVGMFGRHYKAIFAEAGGISSGNPVVVSGVSVGRVESVKLADKGVEVDFSITNGSVHLGDTTTAAVEVSTILGGKELVLTPSGTQTLAEGSTIPLAHTTSAYDINDALSTLTDKAAGIDVPRLSRALDQVSSTVTATAPELRSTLAGVSRLSQTIASRNGALQALLGHANQFAGILADRSKTLTTLITDGNSLMQELLVRKYVIDALIVNVHAMAVQLSGLIDDNNSQLAPTLNQLNQIVGLLQKNKANLQAALKGASVYATEFGEAVNSGPYFSAILQNLLPGNLFPSLGGGQ